MVDTVKTEDELLDIFADGQGNSSISAQDMRDYIVSMKYLGGQQWEFHLDGEYTVGSPLTVAAGVRTKITIDGALGDFGHPLDRTDVWNIATDKIEPLALNNFGLVRLAITGFSDAAATNRFELELDVSGGTPPVIFQETGVFAKGAGNAQSFNFSVPLFVGPDFFANGGEFFIQPLADASFWEFALTLVIIHIARP